MCCSRDRICEVPRAGSVPNGITLMYVSDDKSHAVVFVYGLNRQIGTELPTPLQLQGLAVDRRYKVEELNREKFEHTKLNGKSSSGDTLMTLGLPLRLQPEYDSAVFELTEVKKTE